MSNELLKLSWIRTADIHEYDVINAFNTFKEIDWRKSNFSIKKGDIVYIYVGKPYSKIMYKTMCVKDDVLPEETIDDKQFYVMVNRLLITHISDLDYWIKLILENCH